MTESITYKIRGVAPLIMHNGQTADPLNQFARSMKKCATKRNKTDDDLAVLSTLEWWAGLYTTKTLAISDDFSVKAPADTGLMLPAHVLDSAIREGARKSKLGKQASAGVIVEGDAAFLHRGDANINGLARDAEYVARHAVKVGAAKVMRTRPIFREWGARFTVCVDVSVIDPGDVRNALEQAGRLVGIGDWRPGAPRGGSYGRFVVES